jgi:divalent metal cation (Fe/Co/Zn/Cd) transporter
MVTVALGTHANPNFLWKEILMKVWPRYISHESMPYKGMMYSIDIYVFLIQISLERLTRRIGKKFSSPWTKRE